ncbi:MAG: S8 family serine peptidase [Pyrinomonadaceae bacterium]
MSCTENIHSRSSYSRANLPYRVSIALCLSLILFLSAVPLTSGRAPAQQNGPAIDAEALFLLKADPLLQIIRRAGAAQRKSTRTELNGLNSTSAFNAEARAEVNSLSRIAGVEGWANGATRVSLTVTLKNGDATGLTAAGFAVSARLGQLATIETDVESLPRLASLASVSKLTAAARSYPNNDLSRRAIGVDDVSGQRTVSQTGRGVVVAVIDDGIDFRHPDFTVPGTNGQQTRIKALLDMTVYNPQAPPLPPDPDWNYILPGATAPIGHLYTEADINAALRGQTIIQQRNKTGHGTHVAGTAAGNGLAGPVPGKYAGIAPEADLIIVKASRQNDGTDNFLDTDQVNALAFIQQKATELGEPFVINMSMAGHAGPHDGTRANERAIDEIVGGGAGRAVCISGGSTGDMHAHASGQIAANSDLNLRLNVRNATQVIWLSYAKADSVTVSVTRPDGVQSAAVAFNPTLAPGLSNQYMDIYNTLDDKRDTDPQNDQKAMIILLKPGATALGPAPHTWTLTLHGDSITNGYFDAWASLEGDFISHIDDTRQTTIPGTARGGITVGGYVTRAGDRAIGDYASFSSPGPTADGRLKPEISAPAFTVYSSKAEGSIFFNSPLAPDSSFHVGAYGNSFATPAVTSAVALLLQANPQLTTAQIKEIIRNTAKHDSFTGGAIWHERFGAGKLDIATALGTLPSSNANSIDDARFFVRQHYLDFLNRPADQDGLDYWSSQITQCGTDQNCINSQRIGVSAAYFIELEFQDTGSFIYRFYKASYGVRPTYSQFMPDRSSVVGGSDLETSKQQFAEAWVLRPEFLLKYPASLDGSQFIAALINTVQQGSGVDLSSHAGELLVEYNLGTSMESSRARALRKLIEYQEFKTAEYNKAFVLMQYFGYLRRDPDEGGYLFWLDVLNNRVPGNFRSMVCAFITSAEYQLRFGAAVTHTNQDCAQ